MKRTATLTAIIASVALGLGTASSASAATTIAGTTTPSASSTLAAPPARPTPKVSVDFCSGIKNLCTNSCSVSGGVMLVWNNVDPYNSEGSGYGWCFKNDYQPTP
jgi:hypothetical protein